MKMIWHILKQQLNCQDMQFIIIIFHLMPTIIFGITKKKIPVETTV